MARAKYISEFERDIVRIGVSRGFKAPQISRYLERNKQAIYNVVEQLTKDGTIGNLPMCFIIDEIAEGIRVKGALNGKE